MSQRFVAYPKEAQRYLSENYGLPTYSERHLQVLIEKGKYPRPIKISERRRASLVSDLDKYAQSKIEESRQHATAPAPQGGVIINE